MDKILAAIEALEQAVADLKKDSTLTFDDVVSAALLVDQVQKMTPGWRNEVSKFERQRQRATTSAVSSQPAQSEIDE